MHIITHRNRRERKPAVNTQRGRMSANQRFNELRQGLHEQRKRLRRKDGMGEKGQGRLVASIPAEVIREVHRNDGADAVKDSKYLIRRAKELGLPVEMGRSTRRR